MKRSPKSQSAAAARRAEAEKAFVTLLSRHADLATCLKQIIDSAAPPKHRRSATGARAVKQGLKTPPRRKRGLINSGCDAPLKISGDARASVAA